MTKDEMQTIVSAAAAAAAKAVIEALQKPPPEAQAGDELRDLHGKRKASPLRRQFRKRCVGSVQEKDGAVIRVSCVLLFQDFPAAKNEDEDRAAMTKCIGIERDDLGRDGGDLYVAVRTPWEKKFKDALREAETNVSQAEKMRAEWTRHWKHACFLRGRKVLFNLLLGRTQEQVASLMTLSDEPPMIESGAPEARPAAAE